MGKYSSRKSGGIDMSVTIMELHSRAESVEQEKL
jgi:hypothetical protein